MFRAVFRTLFFVVLFVTVISHASEWRFSIGAGLRNQTPVVLIGGVGYSNLMLYVQGMGFHNGPNDYWCGVRGSLLWTFFKDFPFLFLTNALINGFQPLTNTLVFPEHMFSFLQELPESL